MAARRARIEVGDEVRFRFGPSVTTARVAEDRGGVGTGGRQIVVVELDAGGEPVRFEMPAAELTVVRRTRRRRVARG